jgi:hypothetical protein
MPVATRKQLVDLPDDMAIRLIVVFYSYAHDAIIKELQD